MVTSFLRYLRTSTRDTRLRGLANAAGLTRVGRDLYNRRVLGEGICHTRLLGNPLRFEVDSLRQIKRIENLCHERPFLERMATHVAPGSSFWDIGANIGVVSLGLGAAVGRLRVEAFEPEPRSLTQLRHNLLLNRASNCRVHGIALSNHDGVAPLLVHPQIGSGSHSLDITRSDIPGAQILVVAARRADALAGELGVPQAVKLDVEGAELLVLDGMRATLASGGLEHVFVELHPAPIPLADGCNDADALLQTLGFRRIWQHQRGSERLCHFQRG